MFVFPQYLRGDSLVKNSDNKALKVIVTFILSATLVFVVVLGQIKFKKAAVALKAESVKIQESKVKDKKESGSEVSTDNGEKTSEESLPAVNNFIYKGASSIGTSDNNRWKNKKWLALGDNITAKNSYQSRVKYSCSIGTVLTDANIGKLMGDVTQNLNSDKLKDVDIITIFAGTSDYSLNTPLGTINDDENTNTFYGSVHKTIKRILELKEDATIVFFTPLKRGAYKTYPVYPAANGAGAKLEDYAEAIKDVCKSYNILVLDLFSDSGIDESNVKKYTVDGLHLNDAGSQRISKLISDYLKTIK